MADDKPKHAKPWTKAIEEFLSDGEWHTVEETRAVGIALVTEERALHEMGEKQATQSNERRIAVGKRNVAGQSISGMVRFGKAEYGDSRKKVRLVSDASSSLGVLTVRVNELTETVERLHTLVEALEAQVDFLQKKVDGEDPGEQLLASASATAGLPLSD